MDDDELPPPTKRITKGIFLYWFQINFLASNEAYDFNDFFESIAESDEDLED